MDMSFILAKKYKNRTTLNIRYTLNQTRALAVRFAGEAYISFQARRTYLAAALALKVDRFIPAGAEIVNTILLRWEKATIQLPQS